MARTAVEVAASGLNGVWGVTVVGDAGPVDCHPTPPDVTPPTLTCPLPLTVECGTDVAARAIAAFVAGATATDDRDPAPMLISDAPASFGLGTQPVTFTCSDAAGNAASCSSSVRVVDTLAPTLTLPATTDVDAAGPYVKLLASAATCRASFAGQATAADACDPAPRVQAAVALPAALRIGTALLGYTATDASGLSAARTLRAVVVAPVAVELRPGVFARPGNGRFAAALLEFPTGCLDPAAIDVDSLTLQLVLPIASSKLHVAPVASTHLGDKNHDHVRDLLVRFDRRAVRAWLAGLVIGAHLTFLVEGRLTDGRRFEGTAQVRIGGDGEREADDDDDRD